MTHDHSAASTSYLHFQRTLQYHETMLGDHVRNCAFEHALRKRVTRGAHVLDIGSGTGIWAVVAARLGAAKVVAIEKDPILIPVINNLARENGVADRVQAIRGDSREISLKQKFDVVVSEMIGNQSFDEDIVPIMVDARKRFLKRGGALIPSEASLWVAPAHWTRAYPVLPAGVPITCRYVDFICENLPTVMGPYQRAAVEFVSRPVKLMGVDLTRIKTAPDFENMTARWKSAPVDKVNCFVVWAESELTRGVNLDTLETSHWKAVAYPVQPSGKKRAALEFKLSLSDQSTIWSVLVPGQPERSYSPIFPLMSIQAQVQALGIE